MTENKVCPVGTKVQSLIFSKENYTENSAKKWAKGHDYKFEYVDEKEQTFRIRQKNPKYFDTDSFRTIDITDGIQAVIGCPKIKMENGGEFVFITDRQINDECILELVELIRSEKSISSWFIDKINFNLVIVFDKEIIIDDISKFKDLVLKFDICHDVIKPEINIENNKEKKVIFIPLITDDISVGEFEDGGSVGNIKPIFDFMKSNPMQQARAINVLEKKIRYENKVMPIYQLIEGFEKGLEVGTSKINSSKSEKGYIEKLIIGNYIVNYKAEQDYYKYLQDGGESYSTYLDKKKKYDEIVKKEQEIIRAEANRIREEENKIREERVKKAKNEQIKSYIEKGKQTILQYRISNFENNIKNLKNKPKTKSNLEEISYNERMIEQAIRLNDSDYKIATELYKIENGEVEKKFDWKVGDKVLYDDRIETEIIEIRDNYLDKDATYKVEKKEGIYNQFISYDGLFPINKQAETKETIQEKELQKKVTGSLFKGENWEYFVNQIPEYFLKTFNAPLGLENRSNVLSENFTSYYGEKDIEIFLLNYKKYPNATTFIKAGGYTTKLPKFASDYLYDILNKNNETLQGSKEEESIIENVSENKVNEFGIIANVNTLNITTEKGRFGVTTYPKAFEQLKEYRDSYNNQYKIKVSLNPLVMPTEDANTIYRKLKKYANDYDFDISVNLIENDKGEIEDIEYPEGKSYIYLINRNYKKNNTDKMENKYDYNNLIKVDDVKIIDTYEGDDVKRISFIWNDNFYKWRYRFSKTSSSLNIIKYPSLIDLENSNTFGKSHNQGIIIYNTFNSEQTTDEGTYIEFSISKWDKKNIFSKSGETLQGGKADKLTVEDIAKKHNVSIEYANEQLNKGIKIESEHTDDIEKQREIALDHLSEFIEYYSKLEKMEEEMKKENLQENKYITNEMEQPKLEINSTTVKNWSEIPTIWKNTNKVKKINFINSPYNKELIRLVTPFAGNDVLRPVFSGINFDKNGITVTDAYKLITLPYPNKDYDGTYATISKTATKSANLNKDLFTEKYPNYENLIPSENKIENTFNISVYKLLQYVNVALHYNDSITNNINFAVGNKKVGLNGNYLKQVLEAILKLGYENIYVHFKSDTKTSPVLFTPENKFKLGEDTIIILMPIFIKDDETLGASDIDFERYLLVYYDFSKDQVINEDGSIAEFKMNYGEYDIISDNEINLIESITKSNKSIPISEYFKVDNGKILFTNFQSFVSIKNENLKNGLYKVIDNAIEYDSSFSLGNFDEFPVVDNVENIKIKFIISSDVLKHYLKSAFDFVGNDDLRPIMNGVLFDYRNKNMFIVSTNAHYLYRVNITKFIEINNIEEDFQFIVNEDLIKFLENIEESVLTVSASNNGGYVGNHFIVENENCKIVSRQIDGKYPNYLAAIPIKSDKKLTLNIKKIFECLKDKETVNYIKENKKNDIKIYDVVKNTSEVEMRLYYNERGDYLPHNEIKICDLEYQLENGEFYSKDDLILLMGLKNDTKSNNNFSFTLEFFQTVLENLNCKDLEILFSEKNRGYVFSGDCFGYESTIKYKKDKPKIELSNQQKEIKDAIETLTALTSLGGDENEVKEWNDAIETLKMLLEEDIKKLDEGGKLDLNLKSDEILLQDGGEMKQYKMEEGGTVNFVPITTPL